MTRTRTVAGPAAAAPANTAPAVRQRFLAEVVDADRYPLAVPDAPGWASAVASARAGFHSDGCAVLRGFVRPGRLDALRQECAALAGRAYYEEQTVNVYNTAPDESLPAGHPARRTMRRGNAFVARSDIPADFIVHRLYASAEFQRFVAACLGRPALHPLADPLAGLCVNIVPPGREHPWHFDTNEFAVSMLTQEPASGGVFEYCPHIRSADAENFPDVAAVLDGTAAGAALVRRLPLRAGDLQIFHGRYSMHRVSAVSGPAPRYSAIFSYSDRPGVIGSPERTRQLFGRLTEMHATGSVTRADGLLD